MTEDFKVRAYGKSELACMYFPMAEAHTASNRLLAWIKRNEQLSARLREVGYVKGAKLFTPKEVSIIVEYLGEP